MKTISRRQTLSGYMFLLPNIIGFLAFVFVPVAFSFGLSFFKWDLAKPPVFIGIDNFIEIFTKDQIFYRALLNTAYYAILVIPFGIIVALALAIVLKRNIKGRAVFRGIFFVPVTINLVAIGIIWRWMYNTEFGLVNFFLKQLGLPIVQWLTNRNIAIIALALVTIWAGTGYNVVIFLAGLQGIPGQLYEAAKIDGASSWGEFIHITIPALSQTTFFILVMAVINTFQVFDLIFIMTGGGPAFSTISMVYYSYQQGFQYFKMGYASAIVWILFIIIFVITLVLFRLQKKRFQY